MSEFENPNNEEEDVEEEDVEEEEELTNEEKLQIAQHYLLSSPPGQFQEVLQDVRKIVPPELISNELAGGIARVSNIKNSRVVVAPSGKKTVLSQESEVDATHYIDAQSGTVFSVDHLTLSTSEDAATLTVEDEGLELYRSAVQDSVNKYVSAHYSSDMSAGGVFISKGGGGKLSVTITGEKTNLKNFWSGRWTSSWTVEVDSASSSGTISGEIKVHVHYFEDGNLQLQSGKTIPQSTISFDSENDLGSKVVNLIQTEESALQSGFEDMYTNMNQETFRSMRRVMPITRTKMEWNVNAVRMVKQVRK
mmetsp:Transcript_21649/g.36258  ORF Transcript_21649/g.36258 Transcript_21649/m.36258 type:complete len:307 (+) Transcript_21649:108-1028(+)|eukprot:CAMPEP_0174993442 /NCGR_PEP_ID=MMETSP0004_2-20121128/23078_1 /TAXON_ID=420556 /ORGANISM="Ochromonas sp., Strain CCMP1393" /LENGTH=306 /DNA_ID=CAMNT_0016247559 /DNA_START=36 /DNA_END=956 /DNA_ORIENTATION=+